MTDPFEILGVSRSVSLGELRAARRRLAFELHPDRGGDAAAMRALNAAFDAAVGHLTGRRPLPEPAPATRRGRRRGAAGADRGATASPGGAGTGAARTTEEPRRPQRDHDIPSFVIEALPVEAFEALAGVAGWIGEVLDDEPPYLLEVHLFEPSPCWCRLELVPDAGASTVSLFVASDGGQTPPPPVEDVRDLWVTLLNQW